MKIERVSGKEERRIITGMIVDDAVCSRIAGAWKPELFQSKWANLVGELCVKFNQEFGTAPRKAIEPLFEAWAARSRDKDTVALAEKLLSGLSGEYEAHQREVNAVYTVDLAAKHFTRVRLRRLTSRIEGELDQGNLEKADEIANEYAGVKLGTGSAIDVLQDMKALERAFEEKKEPLITLRGGLGKFFGESLTRSAFIAILAPEKRGKTWWLVELAWQAMLQRRRVAFFSVGDESEAEMLIRFCVRAARHPMRAGTIKYPIFFEPEVEGDKKVHLKREDRVFADGLSYQKGRRAFEKTQQMKLKSKKSYLRMSVHPTSSLSIKAMDAQLKDWAKEGWVADVVIVDYLDILEESGKSADQARDRINKTWKDFRGLTQRWNVCGIGATQANAAGGMAEILDRSNNSEDKRKLAHVTGMVGLNQNDKEKARGVMRLNWIVRRGAYYTSNRTCKVAGCLDIGSPAIKSWY